MLIRTKRLILSPLKPGDLHRLSFLNFPSESDQISIVKMRCGPERWLKGLEGLSLHEGGAWSFKHAVTREIIGLCCYGDFKPKLNQVTLTYGLEAKRRGRGYAREAVSAAVDRIFNLPAISLIAADIEPLNARSIRLAEALGFACSRQQIRGGNGRPAERYHLARDHWLSGYGAESLRPIR